MGMTAVALAAWGAACAPAQVAPGTGPEPEGPGAAGSLAETRDGVRRAGSLRQDQISVRLTADDIRVEVTPLADWVLEAAAPDTRDRLARIASAHGPGLGSRIGSAAPVLFLVTFSSMRPGGAFEPDDLHMLSRGLRERPAAIAPISPDWGTGQLEMRASAMAVYAYPESVDLSRDLVVTYRGVEDGSWSRVLEAVERERGRVG